MTYKSTKIGENRVNAIPDTKSVLENLPDKAKAFLFPAINMCVLPREISPLLRSYVDEVLAPITWKRQQSCLAADPDLLNLLPDDPAHPGRDLFCADLKEQIYLVAGLTGEQQIHMKLECFADSNMCDKFHRDQVVLRSICTYAGPGTEWKRTPEGKVQHMERFAVGLMKGDLWPGNTGNGVLHRSPSIKGTNIRRVVFKIDVNPGRKSA